MFAVTPFSRHTGHCHVVVVLRRRVLHLLCTWYGPHACKMPLGLLAVAVGEARSVKQACTLPEKAKAAGCIQ